LENAEKHAEQLEEMVTSESYKEVY